jgi:hypothetical protein
MYQRLVYLTPTVSIQKIRSVTYWYGESLLASGKSYMVAPQVPGLSPVSAFSRSGPEISTDVMRSPTRACTGGQVACLTGLGWPYFHPYL